MTTNSFTRRQLKMTTVYAGAASVIGVHPGISFAASGHALNLRTYGTLSCLGRNSHHIQLLRRFVASMTSMLPLSKLFEINI
ncbi:MAG: hypothetical protein ABGY21_08740 [Pseudomonadota bacterium]